MVESGQTQEIALCLPELDDPVSISIVECSVPSVVSIGVSLNSHQPIEEETRVRDILQQALEEVKGEYQSGSAIYGIEGTLSNDSEIPVDTVNPTESEIGMTCVESNNADEEHDSYAYFGQGVQSFTNVQPFNYSASEYVQSIDRSHNILPDMLSDQDQFLNSRDVKQSSENLISQSSEVMKLTRVNFTHETIQPGFVDSSCTSAVQGKMKMAPLGSSQNPIRIIQQGNKYKSLQNLTPEQLAQIMQVVQQQQLLRSSQQTGQASILYNPQTQTKIVFRVVYPSELHKNASISVGSAVPLTELSSTKSSSHVLKKTYQKRRRAEEEKGIITELSKQEKEFRKKHRQRTRYGRVSRPPQYMIKDYKHIHPVDYDEDYDDSDGGYSDFKEGVSEDEAALQNAKTVDHEASGQLENGKPRKHKCNTCEKSYIGVGGLARHYRLNPTHGNLPNDIGTDACNSNDSFQNLTSNQPQNFVDGTGSSLSSSDVHCFSSSDVSKVAAVSTMNPFEDHEQTCSSSLVKDRIDQLSDCSTPVHANQQKRAKRGRPPSHQQAERRKERLQELVCHCTDEELMEVVLPRLSSSVNLWEFLLMKSEQKASQPDLNEIIKEFDDLRKQVMNLLHARLIPISTHSNVNSCANDGQKLENGKAVDKEDSKPLDAVRPITKTGRSVLEISEFDVAQCLGLTAGFYEVKDDKPLRQYKLLTANPAHIHENPSQTTIRTVELVSQEQLITLPLRKRLRLTENVLATPAAAASGSSNCVTAAPEYAWKSLPTCESLVSAVFGKTTATKCLETESTASVNETLPVGNNHMMITTSSCLSNRLIAFVNPSHDSKPANVPSSLVAKEFYDSPTSVVENDNHLVKYKSKGCTQPCLQINDQDNTILVSNAVQAKPSSKIHHVVNSTVSSYHSHDLNPFCNDSINEIQHFSARTRPPTSIAPLNCSSILSSDELHSLTVVKSMPENNPCLPLFVSSPKITNTNLFTVSSHNGVTHIANSGSEEQETIITDAERLSTEVRSLQFMSGNTEEETVSGAHAEADFISSPVQAFVQTVDPQMAGSQEESELTEYTSTHHAPQMNDDTHDLIIIQNPDGTIQIHGQSGQELSFETVQALVGFEQDSQIVFQNVQHA